MSDGSEREPRPLLRVVHGTPTEVELAALLTALATRGAAAAAAQGAPTRPNAWSERRRLVRAPLHPGAGAWRTSALPR